MCVMATRDGQPTIVHMISSPVRGAPREIMYRLVAAMDRDRYQPAVAFLRHGLREAQAYGLDSMLPEFEALGVPVCVAGMEHVYDVRGAATLDRFFRDVRVDVIVSHLNRSDMWAGVMGWWGRAKTIRCVHGLESWRTVSPPDPKWLLRKADEWLLRKADKIVCVSPESRRVLIDYQHVPSGKTIVIPGGIDVAKYRTDAPLLPPDRPPTVAMVTRLQSEKGLTDFVDAVGLAQKDIPALRALVAGLGPDAERMQSRAHEIGAVIEFLGHVEDVPGLLRQIDVFVLPSYHAVAQSDGRLRLDLWNVAREWKQAFWGDGTPLSLLEAMSAGRVCVVSNVGGEHVVDDGRTGVIVPARHPEILGRALTDLVRTPERSRSLGRAAAEASHAFSTEAMCQRWDAVYEEVLASAAGGN